MHTLKTWRGMIGCAALVGSVLAQSPARAVDFGAQRERELRAQAQKLFGFKKPLDAPADTPSTTVPGDQAVAIAKGLDVQIVSDRVGENADMIALWPDDDNPTHAII